VAVKLIVKSRYSFMVFCFLTFFSCPPLLLAEEEVKVIKVIDKNNVDEIKDLLPLSHYKRVKEWGQTFRIIPTTHNFSPSQSFQEATRKYADQSRIGPKGELLNYRGGTPFPDPQTGAEVAWNMERRYAGDDFNYNWALHLMSSKGKERLIKGVYQQIHWTGRTDLPPLPDILPNPDNVMFKEFAYQTFPYELKNLALVNIRYWDPDKEDACWVYISTMRRLRRFGTSQRCDSYVGSDATWDDFRGCNWKLNRMSYKLMEKKEMYVVRHQTEPLEYCKTTYPQRTNEILEKAPVYIVEVRCKEPGYIYSKRVMYIDGETFYPINQDIYDIKGRFWKCFHALVNIREKNVLPCSTDIYDYQRKGSSMYDTASGYSINSDFPPEMFTTSHLKKLGR